MLEGKVGRAPSTRQQSSHSGRQGWGNSDHPPPYHPASKREGHSFEFSCKVVLGTRCKMISLHLLTNKIHLLFYTILICTNIQEQKGGPEPSHKPPPTPIVARWKGPPLISVTSILNENPTSWTKTLLPIGPRDR